MRRPLLLLVTLSLAGCGTWNAITTSAGGTGAGLQAVLRPGGASAGAGLVDVRFVDRGDGVFATVFATNLPPGQYRVAVHQNPNCSSPNLFSAGPAWTPPGSTRTAQELMPEFHTNTDGDATLTVQIHGVHAMGPDGLQGHSVVLHYGSRLDDAVPGQPNNRVLCGVLGAPLSFTS